MIHGNLARGSLPVVLSLLPIIGMLQLYFLNTFVTPAFKSVVDLSNRVLIVLYVQLQRNLAERKTTIDQIVILSILYKWKLPAFKTPIEHSVETDHHHNLKANPPGGRKYLHGTKQRLHNA